MRKLYENQVHSHSSRAAVWARWLSMGVLGALAACSRASEPEPAASTSAAAPAAPAFAAAPAAETPRPRYVVSGARVLGTERTPQTDQALNIVRNPIHRLVLCYAPLLEHHPKLSGSIALELTLQPIGALSDLDLKPSKDELEPVVRCVYETLGTTQVALPDGLVSEPLRMHYDLAFKPAPPDPGKGVTVVEPGDEPAAPTAPN